MVQFVRPATGMGACCSSCAHGKKCGLGLFDSGFDVTQWGWPEFTIAALGGYMLLSTVFTTKRAARGVREGFRRGRKRVARRIAGD
jgi:hypothetical protein